MYGLKKVLENINEEGLENRWNRHIEMAEYVRSWTLNHKQNFFTRDDSLSYTLTCIENVQNWDIESISNKLLSRGFRMDRGYGKYRCKTFRIPHMGNIYMDDLKEYLKIFEEVIC